MIVSDDKQNELRIALMCNTFEPLRCVFDECKFNYQHFEPKEAKSIPNDYDLYIKIDHGDYLNDLSEDLHPSIFYAVDTHLKKPYKKIKKQASHYDVVFCAQFPGFQKLRKETDADIQWLSLGCDTKNLRKLELPKIYDVGFIGRDAKKFDRSRHLELLSENFPESFIGKAKYFEIPNIYCSSKIGFNSSINNDVNKRIFEIMACGCFLLTNQINNSGFNLMFKEGEHLVTYGNHKDMLNKAHYYLKHEREREEIAQRGYDLVRSSYTYHHTLQRMFNYVAFKFGGKYNSLRI